MSADFFTSPASYLSTMILLDWPSFLLLYPTCSPPPLLFHVSEPGPPLPLFCFRCQQEHNTPPVESYGSFHPMWILFFSICLSPPFTLLLTFYRLEWADSSPLRHQLSNVKGIIFLSVLFMPLVLFLARKVPSTDLVSISPQPYRCISLFQFFLSYHPRTFTRLVPPHRHDHT